MKKLKKTEKIKILPKNQSFGDFEQKP